MVGIDVLMETTTNVERHDEMDVLLHAVTTSPETVSERCVLCEYQT